MSANSGHLAHLNSLAFTVYGTPAGQGSKRHVGHGVMIEQSKRVRPWREAVKHAALTAIDEWNSAHCTLWEPLAGPVHITVAVRIARPKSHYRTGRFAAILRDDAPTYAPNTPDLDKALRAIFDALTDAGVWRDDRQVVAVYATKVYDSRPGAVVRVEAVHGGGSC